MSQDSWLQDMAALFDQRANEQVQNLELNLIGRVIEYDVKTNMVRVLLDTRRGEALEDPDEPMETGWCQLGSPIVGKNWGLQYCLEGGADKDNNKGELVQVSIQDRTEGLAAVANLVFTDEMPPPGGGEEEEEGGGGGGGDDQGAEEDSDGTQQLKPKEFILKHESGSFIKFYEDGSVRLTVVQDLFVEVQEGDANVDVLEGDVIVNVDEGDLTATVKGDTTLDVLEGDLEVNVNQGDASITVDEGDLDLKASEGDVTISAGKDVKIKALKDIILEDGTQ